MLKKFLTVFTLIAISLFAVNVNNYKGFKPNQSHATENNYPSQENNNVNKTEFGRTEDGQKVYLYTLTNTNGLVAKITNYGAILTELHLPDNKGKLDDVVLGFDTLENYFAANRYVYSGAVVGRVANKIKDAKFTLDGQNYNLAANAAPHHIHGGNKGFDKVVWQAEPIKTERGQALKLTYLSTDGEEGYPGNLKVTAIYTLTNDNELKLEMIATTDKPTPVNLVNHSYWNLGGHANGDILEQYLTIDADRYTPSNEQGIPTGKIKSVKGTPYDFTQPRLIGEGMNQLRNTLKQNYPGGYDLNYVLNGKSDRELRLFNWFGNGIAYLGNRNLSHNKDY
jgi:aldose 1-epimerase